MGPWSRSIGARLLLIALAMVGSGVMVLAQGAGDTVATMNTGGLELTIDSKAFYNGKAYPASTWSLKNLVPGSDKFFSFADVKPGDVGSTTISIHLKKSAAWACLSFSNFKDKENTIIEPEVKADPNGTASGELGKDMEFFAWSDDGDGKFEPPAEKPLFGTSTQSAIGTVKNITYALADSKHGSAWSDGSTHYVGVAWCAGDLQANLTTGKIACSGASMGNEAQTDSLSVDIALSATASKDNAKYLCNGGGGDSHHDDHDEHDDHDPRDHYVSHGFFDYGHGSCSPVGRH